MPDTGIAAKCSIAAFEIGDDVNKDAKHNRDVDKVGIRDGNMITVPQGSRGKPIGVMQVLTRRAASLVSRTQVLTILAAGRRPSNAPA